MKDIAAITIQIKPPNSSEYNYVCKSIDEYTKAIKHYKRKGFETKSELTIVQEAETLAELKEMYK